MRGEMGPNTERFTSMPGANFVDTMQPVREIENADGVSPLSAAQLVAAKSLRKEESASTWTMAIELVAATCSTALLTSSSN
mmetsp:Transcript_27577/g.45821  ORF Transcript_27577/g.45821 Transcript_27577/m.45821 type:complete len:81 (+) Transcript_27577:1567-1809(+)